MSDKPNVRERRALEGMAACTYGFELRKNLGPAGSATLLGLCERGWAKCGVCPVSPDSNGWAITDAGREALKACASSAPARSAAHVNALTAKQCCDARQTLGWSILDLAIQARCAASTIQDFEDNNRQSRIHIRRALLTAFEKAGVIFCSEGNEGVNSQLRTEAS